MPSSQATWSPPKHRHLPGSLGVPGATGGGSEGSRLLSEHDLQETWTLCSQLARAGARGCPRAHSVVLGCGVIGRAGRGGPGSLSVIQRGRVEASFRLAPHRDRCRSRSPSVCVSTPAVHMCAPRTASSTSPTTAPLTLPLSTPAICRQTLLHGHGWARPHPLSRAPQSPVKTCATRVLGPHVCCHPASPPGQASQDPAAAPVLDA